MTKRLVVSYVALTLLILVTLAYPLGRTFATRERDRLLRDVEHDAVVVASFSEDALERGERPPIGDILTGYARDPGGRIVVVDAAGRSVADSATNATLGVDFTNREEVVSALAGRRAEGQRYSKTAGGDLLYVAIPVASSGTVFGAVRITYPTSTLDERIRTLWLALGSLAALATGLAAILGFVLARLVTRPVAKLKAAANQIAAGDLDARAPTDTGAPELRELAAAFNQSAEQVQTVLASQQAFVADASHQLRTPLAALRLQLENIESRAPARLQDDLAAVRAETARLTRISETLLALARAPSSAAALQPTDLATLVRERVAAWTAAATELGVALPTHDANDAWVIAAPGAIEQILDNLIDNALEASPPDTAIEVAIVAAGDATELHVADRGPGLTEEQRRRAFDRFWRGPRAEPGGTGLGLPIVEQLAHACGGHAELRARNGGGTDAVVTLRTFTSR